VTIIKGMKGHMHFLRIGWVDLKIDVIISRRTRSTSSVNGQDSQHEFPPDHVVEVGERGWSQSIDEVGWRSRVEGLMFGVVVDKRVGARNGG
jgi:hypothetical protein